MVELVHSKKLSWQRHNENGAHQQQRSSNVNDMWQWKSERNETNIYLRTANEWAASKNRAKEKDELMLMSLMNSRLRFELREGRCHIFLCCAVLYCSICSCILNQFEIPLYQPTSTVHFTSFLKNLKNKRERKLPMVLFMPIWIHHIFHFDVYVN